LDDLKQTIKTFATEVDNENPSPLDQVSALKVQLSEAHTEMEALKVSNNNEITRTNDAEDAVIKSLIEKHSIESALLKSQLESLRADAAENVAKENSYRSALQEFNIYKTAKVAEIADLQAQLSIAQSDSSAHLDISIKAEEEKFEERLQTELCKSKEHNDKELESLRDTLTQTHSDELSKLIIKFDECQRKINELRAENKSLTLSNAESERKLKECVDELDKQHKILDPNGDTLQEEFDAYKKSKEDELENLKTVFSEKCAALSEKYDFSCEAEHSLQGKFNAYRTETEAELAQLRNKISKVNDSSDQVNILTGEFEVYKASKEAEIADLQGQFNQASDSLEELNISMKEKVSKFVLQVDELRAEIESLASTNAGLEQKVEEFLTTKSEDNTKIHTLEAEIKLLTINHEDSKKPSVTDSQPSSESSAVNIDSSIIEESFLTTESTQHNNPNDDDDDDWGDAWGDEEDNDEL